MLVGSGLVLLLWIVVWIAGFVDALMSDSERVRVMPKTVWVVLILLFSGFAAIPWFIFGRPRAGIPGRPAVPRSSFGWPGTTSREEPPPPSAGGWQLGGAGRRSGPLAPDDDPEFLRQLGRRKPDDPKRDKPDQPA